MNQEPRLKQFFWAKCVSSADQRGWGAVLNGRCRPKGGRLEFASNYGLRTPMNEKHILRNLFGPKGYLSSVKGGAPGGRCRRKWSRLEFASN